MLLRKYTAVFNITFKESVAYRFDTLTSALFSFVKIYLAYLLWQAIFSGKEIIGGYTFPMMLTYYILITFMTRIARSENIIWETAEEVRTGAYTKYITRPIRHFSYCLSRSLSKGSFSFLVDTVAFLFWILIFRSNFYVPENPHNVIFSAGFALLGLFTLLQIHYLIALISFKTVDIAGPYFFFNNVIDFLSGSFIPLMLLPRLVQKAVSFTPFYYILYFPVSLYLEKETDQMGTALIVILMWNLFFALLRKILYKRMISLYEGVGA